MLDVRLTRALALVFFLLLALPAAYAAPPAGSASAGEGAPEIAGSADPPGDPAAAPAAPSPWRPGPVKVDLGHDLDLDLPEQYAFLGMPHAGQVLEKLGNFHNDGVLGVVVGKADKAEWLVIVSYEEAGFIKDDEEIDADELYKAIHDGTEESNEERVKRGFKALHVEAWAERPRYEKGLHHLVWALTARDEDGTSVNFNTRILGRRGYVALNLVTDPSQLAANKLEAAALLSATHFRQGARYEDFDAGSDKVAEYGLAGLVLGGAGLGAAKLVKLGLLAKFGKVILGVLVAGKKLVVLGLAGLAAMLKRFFSRKSEAPAADE
jgi:uncharacterized membrane-anchored protein